MIEVRCKGCGKKLYEAEIEITTECKCPRCKAINTVKLNPERLRTSTTQGEATCQGVLSDGSEARAD